MKSKKISDAGAATRNKAKLARLADETALVLLAQLWLKGNPALCEVVWEFGDRVSIPRTSQGKAIKAYMEAERSTGFSLGAQDEFQAMFETLSSDII